MAMTLDGRIADAKGASQWITSDVSRRFVHELRRRHAVIAVGRGTLVADNPRLTVRHVQGPQPVRVVFSTKPNLPLESHFVSGAQLHRSIVVSSGGSAGRKSRRRDGVEVWTTGDRDHAESIRTFLSMAFDEGLTSILIEGGQRLASGFLENGLVNRVYLMYATKILGGGMDGLAFAKSLPISHPLHLDQCEVRTFGSDIMVTGTPRREA
jgi:diaminohydroxyphosphoribosylaminopyrimidine deaminase/5-amino-6-(5-phosphoribosylamino)uracil reductase